jgi:hypothetical protein
MPIGIAMLETEGSVESAVGSAQCGA